MTRPTIRRLLICVVAMLLVLGGSAPLVAAPSKTPSNLRSHCMAITFGEKDSPIIAARINGQGPFYFVLDTGSSGTTLDDRRVSQLRLVAKTPLEQGQGMGGSTDVRTFQVQSVTAGPLHVRNIEIVGVPAPSLANWDIAGLAGVDLFRDRLAIWRADRRCVDIRPAGGRPNGRGWEQIASRWLKPWKVLVPIRIGRTRGWGLLDTGSQQTILSTGFARRIKQRSAERQSAGQIAGIDGRATALSSFLVADAAVGRWRYKRVSVSVAALPLFERLGGSDTPLAIIGMDWIGRRRFAIDYGKQSIWQALR